MGDIKKVVLAYSGGLDTSIIIPWLKENYDNCEVIAVSGDVGQDTELEGLEEKAKKTGASKLYIEDLNKEFIEEYVFPTIKADAVYESNAELKFANGSWDVNWGATAFPLGYGTNGGPNIPVKAGAYRVYFNDCLGLYYFKATE